ncbi:hypothetical protein DPX16_21259 [Anabarilius grahami]|uniref:Uncharacterized protein n=1 Tax=Anabarilius grahami TaxID=495550 RepID=A0A3N0XQE3_ANAGA|nr:hypothetical protein DPX16_21259 [Anabarilius grahami]
MSIAASERGLLCSGNEGDAELPTVIVCAYADSDSEFTAMLSRVILDVHGKLGRPREEWEARNLNTLILLFIANGQQHAVQEVNQSLSCTPCPTVEPGKCCTAHLDPATGHLAKRAPQAASLRFTSLPHCGFYSLRDELVSSRVLTSTGQRHGEAPA